MRSEEITLLTIDDDTGLRHGIRDYFEDSGFNVLEGKNGETGLAVFRESKPDVVLVDLRMPGIDGIEVIKTINREAPETPVVVVSGTGVLADAIEAMRHGAWDYVTKPIADMLTLEHIVDRVLERAELLLENKHYQQDLEKVVAQKTADLQTSMVQLTERGEAFEHLAKALVGLSGEDIYNRIIKACAAIFKTESAMLGLLVDEDKIVTSALMVENKILAPISFNLKGTPCAKVIDDGHCFYRNGVCKTFPEAGLLKKLAIEGYIGVCLRDRQGEAIGVLGVFSRIPITLPDHAKNVLDIIAARSSAVIEHEQADLAEKQLQEKLRQAQKMEAIGTLAGGIAHDFNNILSAILGYTELAQERLPQGIPIDNALDQVYRAGTRAKDLVQQILSFSRQSEQELRPLQVHLIVKEALKLLRSSISTTIEIRQYIDPKSGAVLSDATQIHQVVMNLCTNAYHAMRETGGVLTVTMRPVQIENDDHKVKSLDLTPGLYVELTVSDSGVGMDGKTIEKIFDPYFTTKQQGEGTGLGLYVVHGIAKSHGGHITVDSKPGKGTTFRLYLPQIISDTKPERLEVVEDYPTGDESVLLVDDEESLVNLAKWMLSSLGYKVTAMTSSSMALKAFQQEPDSFDLIITDMNMPTMKGTELIQKIRGIRLDIPVVLCTGYSEQVDKENASILGIQKYLMKPVAMRDLATAAREALDERAPLGA